jgi:rhodanese-related sulfurtransferase
MFETMVSPAPVHPLRHSLTLKTPDYIGGHIKGGMNMPSNTLEYMMPTLIRRLEGKQTVVFHCALSQQRGPSAALQYLRQREQIQRNRPAEAPPVPAQTVYVLDGGFAGWQETYGTDERLTEGYRKELWENGY